MFTSAKHHVIAAVATFAVFGVTLSLTPAAPAQSAQSAMGLVGAWSVTVTLHPFDSAGNCAAPVIGTPFPSLLLFSRGGTVTESTSNPGFGPGQRGTGLGVWWLNANGTYGASDVAFILYTSPNYVPGPPPVGMGFAAGTQEITHTITLNPTATAWTDTANVQFYDVNRHPLNRACATATAVRLQ